MNMDYSKAFELLSQDAEKERNKKAEKVVRDNLYNKGFRDGLAVIGKIRAEILDTLYVDSLIFGELIDFKNGKISADDVIEEFNRVTRFEVLKIIDKYKIKSEE